MPSFAMFTIGTRLQSIMENSDMAFYNCVILYSGFVIFISLESDSSFPAMLYLIEITLCEVIVIQTM